MNEITNVKHFHPTLGETRGIKQIKKKKLVPLLQKSICSLFISNLKPLSIATDFMT